MKIVVAPDKFKGSLTATQAAAAIARGVRRAFPNAQIIQVPLADGGEGTAATLVAATHGCLLHRRVTGPLGKPVTATFGILGPVQQKRHKRNRAGGDGRFSGHTAVIEMAEASGLKLVPPDKRNPLLTTTYGTGELIRAALDLGCTEIIVGIGGSATNDAGAGMAQALGWRLLDVHGHDISFGGGALSKLAHIEPPTAGLPRASVRVACDVQNPLYGRDGAAFVYGPQKGATPPMVRELDCNLRHFAAVVKRDLGLDVAHFPGAGAAGGLGAGLKAFLGAELCSGVKLVLEAVHFEHLLHDANLVITAEGKLDEQTAHGKTPWGVAEAARRHGIPVIAFGGSVPIEPSKKLRSRFAAILPIARGPISLEESMHQAARLLETSAAELMFALKNSPKICRDKE